MSAATDAPQLAAGLAQSEESASVVVPANSDLADPALQVPAILDLAHRALRAPVATPDQDMAAKCCPVVPAALGGLEAKFLAAKRSVGRRCLEVWGVLDQVCRGQVVRNQDQPDAHDREVCCQDALHRFREKEAHCSTKQRYVRVP